MRTNTTAAKKAATAKKTTTSAHSGESKPESEFIRWLQIPLTFEDQNAWMQMANVKNRTTCQDWGREILRKAACKKTAKKALPTAEKRPKLPPIDGAARITIQFSDDDLTAFVRASGDRGLTLLEWAYLELKAAWEGGIKPAKADSPWKSPEKIAILHRVAKGNVKVMIHFGLSDVSLNRINELARRRAMMPEDYLSAAICDRIASDSLPSGFDVNAYLKHPGDKFGITATDAQMRAWSRSYKASPFDTLRDWAAAALDAAALKGGEA